MPRLRMFFEEIVEFLFKFNVCMIPFAFLLGAKSQSLAEPLKMLFLLPLVLYHWLLRHRVKDFWLFLILTWASCLVGVLSPHPILYTVFIAFMNMMSVRRRTTNNDSMNVSFEILCFPLVILSVLYICASTINAYHLRPLFYGQAMAIFMLALVYAHLKGINRELEFASSPTLQATKSITSVMNVCLIIYILVFLIVLGLFRYVPFGDMLMAAGVLLVRMIRLIASLLHPAHHDASGGPIEAAEQLPPDVTLKEPPLWLEILEKLLVYSVNILVLLGICFLIVLFFLHMYRGFYKHKRRKIVFNDEVSSLSITKAEKRKRLIKPKIGNNIRRKYYRLVNKYYRKNRFYASDTPEEIKERLNEVAALRELTPLYEGERYTEKQTNCK